MVHSFNRGLRWRLIALFVVVMTPTARGASGATSVTAIAGGGYHTIALKPDGTVWACGLNASGQMGDGTTQNHVIPGEVSGLLDVVAIAAGRYHSVALRADGTVWAWGSNDSGQLGDGTDANRLVPVPVTGLSSVVAIAGGGYHSVAVVSDGTVR